MLCRQPNKNNWFDLFRIFASNVFLMKLAIINGPNLNLLGNRENQIYGTVSMEAYLDKLQERFKEHQIRYVQSNSEAELITAIQESSNRYDGIILNPGGLTHTSVAIADSIRASVIPVIEVHLSHTMARENYRKRSLISPVCRGSISGFGMKSYELGIHALIAD